MKTFELLKYVYTFNYRGSDNMYHFFYTDKIGYHFDNKYVYFNTIMDGKVKIKIHKFLPKVNSFYFFKAIISIYTDIYGKTFWKISDGNLSISFSSLFEGLE